MLAQLQTGRTHQIRVHLAHIGHPVVGDPVYGARRRYPAGASDELRATLDGFHRQALHAAQLSLQHPFTGEALSWRAPLPTDMQGLVAALAADQRAHTKASAASHAPIQNEPRRCRSRGRVSAIVEVDRGYRLGVVS